MLPSDLKFEDEQVFEQLQPWLSVRATNVLFWYLERTPKGFEDLSCRELRRSKGAGPMSIAEIKLAFDRIGGWLPWGPVTWAFKRDVQKWITRMTTS